DLAVVLHQPVVAGPFDRDGGGGAVLVVDDLALEQAAGGQVAPGQVTAEQTGGEVAEVPAGRPDGQGDHRRGAEPGEGLAPARGSASAGQKERDGGEGEGDSRGSEAPLEAEARQEHEARGDGAGDGADGVGGVGPADVAAD